MSEQIKVFFSYGHDHHGEVVKRLAQAIERLSENRIEVWIDHKSIPRDSHWRKEIQEGIYNCNSVVAFLSEYSTRDKGVCLDEIAIALVSKHGMIRTILLEPADSFTPPTMVSEYQWGDMSDYPEVLEKGEEAFSAYIDSQAMQIIKLVSSDEIMQYSAEIKELRRRLAMPERDRMTRFDLLLQKEMTERPWLDNIIKQWIEDKNGSKILMLYGKPGAGKSTYCANLQHYNPRVVASISCDHQSNSFSDTDDIIRYLAYKLALRLPDYRSGLIRLLSDDSFTMKSGKDLFDDLIGQPLGKISIDGHRDSMIICIDALDESKTDELAGFLAEYQAYMRDWVRFLITARKEPNIVSRFESFRAIDLDEYSDQTRADMVAYFHRRLDEKLSDFENRDEFISRLTESSENVFTYAECICDNIIEDIDLGKVKELTLYPVPKGIQSLFTNTLDRKFGSTGAIYTLRDYEDFWQEPLGMIIASETPLPIATLKQLMGWRNNQLRKFRSPLSTLLTESDGCLQTFHRSFGEWLDKEGTPYYSSTEDGASTLAELCFEQYETDIESLDEYMLLNLTKLLRKTKMKKEYERVTGDKAFMKKLSDTQHEYYTNSLFEKAIELADELITILDDGSEDVDRLSDLSSAFFKKAEALHSICHFDDALIYFIKSGETDKKLADLNPDNPQYLRAYSFTLIRTADTLIEMEDIKKAISLYDEVLQINKKIATDHPKVPEYLYGYSVALDRVANLHNMQGNFSEGIKLYREAESILQKLTELYPENTQYLHAYSSALQNLACTCELNSEYDEALTLYQKTRSICEKLRELQPDNIEFLYLYATSLERLADVHSSLYEYEEAYELYKAESEIFEKLVSDFPENPIYIYGYATTIERLASINEAYVESDKALELYQKQAQLLKKLSEDYPGKPRYLYGYTIAMDRIAYIRKEQNQLSEAMKLYDSFLPYLKHLTESYPENHEYAYGYYAALLKIADVYKIQNNFELAIETCSRGLNGIRNLTDAYPEHPGYMMAYSEALMKTAEAYEAIDDTENALILYEENMHIAKLLIDFYPDDVAYLQNYALSTEKVAYLLKLEGNYSEAIVTYEEALAATNALVSCFPDEPVIRYGEGSVLCDMADIYAALGRLEDAAQYSEKGAHAFRRLSESHPDNCLYKQKYSLTLSETADIYMKLKNIDHAALLYDEVLSIDNKLTEENPENPDYRYGYFMSLIKSADIREIYNPEIALMQYEKAAKISRELTRDYPENSRYPAGYSLALERLQDIYEKLGDKEKAVASCMEHLDVARMLKEKYPESYRYLSGYAISLDRTASLYLKQGQAKEAKKLYYEALSIHELLADKFHEDPEALYRLAIAMEKCGDVNKMQSFTNEALDFYRRERELFSLLTQYYPENPAYLYGYTVPMGRAAEIYAMAGMYEEALSTYYESLKIREKLASDFPDVPEYIKGYYVALYKTGCIHIQNNDPSTGKEFIMKARNVCYLLTRNYPENQVYRSYLNEIDNIIAQYLL